MNVNSWRLRKISEHKSRNICPCPTPGGSLFGGGWDTNSPSQCLWRGGVGGVPPVPPLNPLLRMCVRACAHTPEKAASRGGTDGTKYQRRRDPPGPSKTTVALSPPGWDSNGTGVGHA